MALASTIRAATPADLAAIAAAERASFADPWSEQGIGELLESPQVTALVATDDGNQGLVGYLIARVIVDEAEILSVAVLPPSRGLGAGGRLLDQALSALVARGAQAVFLEVRESNVAARSLYERRGFRAVGLRPAYYRSPPEDAVRYQWVSPHASK